MAFPRRQLRPGARLPNAATAILPPACPLPSVHRSRPTRRSAACRYGVDDTQTPLAQLHRRVTTHGLRGAGRAVCGEAVPGEIGGYLEADNLANVG